MIQSKFICRWLELRPPGGHSSFSESQRPPIMKVVVELLDESMANSKQFGVVINIEDSSLPYKYNQYFKGFVRMINSPMTEIDVTDDDYQKVVQGLQGDSNVYYGINHNYTTAATWKWKESYNLNCSINFRYLGSGCNEFSEKVKGCLPVKDVLNTNVIASLLEDARFADFTFIVRGERYKVHKCLLAKASEVFEKMFTCGLDETKDNSATVDCNPVVFQHFLKFIYTGDLPETGMSVLCFDLYELAHLYGIEPLKQVCMAFASDTNIGNSNALQIYQFASTYEIKELLDSAWEFIKV